jgi:hypothetical protein
MAQTPADKLILSKYFAVDIAGMYTPVPNVVEVDAGRVTIDVQECTQGDMPDYRTYAYGGIVYDDLTLVIQQDPKTIKIKKWAKDAMTSGGGGDTLRKDISIHLQTRNKKTIRTINCYQCFPKQFNMGGQSTGSDVKTATLTCHVSRIEVA